MSQDGETMPPGDDISHMPEVEQHEVEKNDRKAILASPIVCQSVCLCRSTCPSVCLPIWFFFLFSNVLM